MDNWYCSKRVAWNFLSHGMRREVERGDSSDGEAAANRRLGVKSAPTFNGMIPTQAAGSQNA